MPTDVIGFFDESSQAEQAARELLDLGFPQSEFSLIASAPEPRSGAADRMAQMLTGLPVKDYPAIGLVAAGQIARLIDGVGLGYESSGGVIDGLVGLGVPEEHAHAYAEGIRRGGTLLTIRAEDAKAMKVAQIFESHEAVNIQERLQGFRIGGFEWFDEQAPVFTAEEIERERRARTMIGECDGPADLF